MPTILLTALTCARGHCGARCGSISPMSPRRKISLIAAVPLGLAAIVFGLACLPSVQTWAARRVLAGQPDLVGTVGRVAIGWNSVRVTDLTLERGGQKLTLPSLEAELPVLAAARGRIDVARL